MVPATVCLRRGRSHQSPYRDLVGRDAVVRVDDEVLRGQRGDLLELGGEEEADGAEQLELALLDVHLGEEAVHVVDGEVKDVGLALLLLRDLQHPVGDDLPHVRLDLRLHRREVVSAPFQVAVSLAALPLDDVVEDAGVLEQGGVLVGAALGEDDFLLLLPRVQLALTSHGFGGEEIVHDRFGSESDFGDCFVSSVFCAV